MLVNISEAASLALHTMAVLASATDQRFTNQGLAARLKASSHHLAKVMQRLAKAGLVDSVRGPQGGFRLGRAAKTVTLLEIYEAVDGPVDDGVCLLGEPLCEGMDCVLGEYILSVHRQMRDYLAETKLSALARGVPLVQLRKNSDPTVVA
ncbi:MAG: Rrf2 family transcriptional regulator [Pirellulaceae bacterium]|nr:Rrf2 family transcriptional regulator [Pirellulaceae bacterium]